MKKIYKIKFTNIIQKAISLCIKIFNNQYMSKISTCNFLRIFNTIKKINYIIISTTILVNADNGGFISYKPIAIPIEFIIGENGVELSGTKSFVTPVGVWKIGYNSDLINIDHNYIYVTIENRNNNRKYIYKINNKNKIHLSHKEGYTDIKIYNNNIYIIVEKGSEVKLEYTIEESFNTKFIAVSKYDCISYGGKFVGGICKSNWKNSKRICKNIKSELPSNFLSILNGYKNTYWDNESWSYCNGYVGAANFFGNNKKQCKLGLKYVRCKTIKK